MTFDRISAHLAEATRTLDYSLTFLDGDPDAIADIEDVIAGLRELRLEIEVQACPPPPACRQSNLAHGLMPYRDRYRPPSPTASGSGHTDERVVWTHQIVERDLNPLAIPPRPSWKFKTATRFGFHFILDKAVPAVPEIADPVQTTRWPQPTLTRVASLKCRDDTHI